MLFVDRKLNGAADTRCLYENFPEVGGSGRSHVGGMPALDGTKGLVLLSRFARRMIIIQLLIQLLSSSSQTPSDPPDQNDIFPLFYYSVIPPLKPIKYMKVTLKSIKILDKKLPPYFTLSTQEIEFDRTAPIVKVLAFSVDPVMKVWLAGAKTNFSVVGPGDTFNCFGVGLVIDSRDQMYPEGSYLFGNTGTCNYFELSQQKQRQCFPIDSKLIETYGPHKYLYLINNGLAAYQGFQILSVKPGDTVLVSTSSGATGLLLLHLLKQINASIIALASPHKRKHILPFTNCILDYKDKVQLSLQLRHLKFNKYFDNVGESLLDVVLQTIEDHGIIALCGSIEHYSSPKEGGLVNYPCVVSKRIKIEGIRFSSLIHRVDQIFMKYRNAELVIETRPLKLFVGTFLELFKSGGAIVGKITIDPHL